SVLAHERMDDGYRNHVLQPLQPAQNQRAVRPRAGKRDMEMVAAGLRLEAAFARWTGPAVGGHPVAEGRVGASEAAGLVALLVVRQPFAFYHASHRAPPCGVASSRDRPQNPWRQPRSSAAGSAPACRQAWHRASGTAGPIAGIAAGTPRATARRRSRLRRRSVGKARREGVFRNVDVLAAAVDAFVVRRDLVDVLLGRRQL